MSDLHPPSSGSGHPSYAPGDLITERHRVVGRLGSGGMGAVYEAEHLGLGRHDAIKVVGGSTEVDPHRERRFQRGIRNAAAIRHPNVCQVYDSGRTVDGRLYLSMELVRGESLGERLARLGPMGVEDALRVGVGIARALEAAHGRGIVHRDLKPDNVMIPDGSEDLREVRVVDFDLARAIRDEDQRLTRASLVIGTPEYMSPEQCLAEEIDGRSDLYSLGLILWRMIRGGLPHGERPTREMLLTRVTVPPPPLSTSASGLGLPEGLTDLVGALLVPDPKKRIGQASTAVAAMEGILEGMGKPSTIRPPVSVGSSTGVPAGGEVDSDALQERAESGPRRASGWTRQKGPIFAAMAAVILGGAVTWGAWPGGSADGGSAESSESAAPEVVDLREGGPMSDGGLNPIEGVAADAPLPQPSAISSGEVEHAASTVSAESDTPLPLLTGAETVDLPASIDELLDAFGTALGSREETRIRELYPDITALELAFWDEVLAGGGDVGLQAQTPLERQGDSVEIRVLMITVRSPDGASRPLPFRALLERTSTGWGIHELRRLN